MCTTKKQSERLLALGIKPNTADMSRFMGNNSLQPYTAWEVSVMEYVTPAWSLGALITLMPDTIIIEDRSCWRLAVLSIGVYYHALRGKKIIRSYESDYIFENCINMIAWLVKNGHIETENK